MNRQYNLETPLLPSISDILSKILEVSVKVKANLKYQIVFLEISSFFFCWKTLDAQFSKWFRWSLASSFHKQQHESIFTLVIYLKLNNMFEEFFKHLGFGLNIPYFILLSVSCRVFQFEVFIIWLVKQLNHSVLRNFLASSKSSVIKSWGDDVCFVSGAFYQRVEVDVVKNLSRSYIVWI